MNASKETAKKALTALHHHGELTGLTGCMVRNTKTLTDVEEFIQAALRKLPSEAAYKKAKTRRNS